MGLLKDKRVVAALALMFISLGAMAGYAYTRIMEPERGYVPLQKVVVRAVQPRPVEPCPLCGRPALPQLAGRTAFMVKMDNEPGARPQAGLNEACLVYEVIIEGGASRYVATYACRDVGKVGPVRSARFSDADLSRGLDAVLVHCGGTAVTLRYLAANGVKDFDEYSNGCYFRRSHSRRAPHNLYSSTARLRRGAARRGFDMDSPPPPLTFREKPGRPGRIGSFSLRFSRRYGVAFAYSRAGAWLRYVNGAPSSDDSGRPVTAKNVIVQFVNVRELPYIEDVAGSRSLGLELVGAGRAVYFRRGEMLSGTWSKPAAAVATEWLDAAGKPLQLDPGTIWVEIVGKDAALTPKSR